MRQKLTLLIFSLLAMLSAAQRGAAYTDRNIEPVRTRGGVFYIEAAYERTEAMAGDSVNLKIKITTPTAGQSVLRILSSPEIDDPSEAAAQFKFALLTPNPAPTDEGGARGVEYLYDVGIPPNADPHGYKVKLQLKYEEEETQSRNFALNVGSKNGKLELVKLAEGSEPQTCEAGFFVSEPCTYNLSFKNNYNDYTVTIEELSLDSAPPALVAGMKWQDEQNQITIGPGDVKEIPLTFAVNPLTLRNMVKGLATTPRLRIRARYNDDKGHPPLTDFDASAPVSIAPRTSVLFGAVLIGLLIGSVVRYIMEFMVWKKQLTRGELMRFVTYTTVFGSLVALLAFIGKIEIKGFTVSGSYDNPLAMLFIGLVGALAGLQLFLGWFKAIRGDNGNDGPAKPPEG